MDFKKRERYVPSIQQDSFSHCENVTLKGIAADFGTDAPDFRPLMNLLWATSCIIGATREAQRPTMGSTMTTQVGVHVGESKGLLTFSPICLREYKCIRGDDFHWLCCLLAEGKLRREGVKTVQDYVSAVRWFPLYVGHCTYWPSCVGHYISAADVEVPWNQNGS